MISSKSSPFDIINHFFDVATRIADKSDAFEKFFGSVGSKPNYKFSIKSSQSDNEKFSRTNYLFIANVSFNSIIISRIVFVNGDTIICGAVNGIPFSIPFGCAIFGETELAASGSVIDVTKYMELDEICINKKETEKDK